MKKVFIIILIILIVVFVRAVDPLSYVQKNNDLKRKSDLSKLQPILEKYYQDNGRYPKYSKGEIPFRIVRLDGITADWGTQWFPYAQSLPKDPWFKRYVYFTSPNGQTYYLYASLERGGKDPQACRRDGLACNSVMSNGIFQDACGGICNYGVTSANASP